MSDGSGPFSAAWGDELLPVQPEPIAEPIQRVADGYHWYTYNSPSGFPGLPVEVRGPYFYMPGDAQRYRVDAVIEKMGGVFTPFDTDGNKVSP